MIKHNTLRLGPCGDNTTLVTTPNKTEFGWSTMDIVSMGIVYFKDYSRSAIAFQWLDILYISTRWMIQDHNLGLGP